MSLSTPVLFLLLVLVLIFVVYIALFFFFRMRFRLVENAIVDTFLKKVSKIPSLIEVMRPYVVDPTAFDTITELHSESMIREYAGIYHLLEHNARIQREFLFLMRLSVQIPELQKHEYFLYIRDFIIAYEREMRSKFTLFNALISHWNTFVFVKNCTVIGLLFPGRTRGMI